MWPEFSSGKLLKNLSTSSGAARKGSCGRHGHGNRTQVEVSSSSYGPLPLLFCNQHNTGLCRAPGCAPCPSVACLTPRSFTTLPSTGSPPALGPSCAALLLAELELPLPAWNSCSCPMMGAPETLASHTLDCWHVCWLFGGMDARRFFIFLFFRLRGGKQRQRGWFQTSDWLLGAGREPYEKV
jgi:hypothetical protein